MMKHHITLGVFLFLGIVNSTTLQAQVNPSIDELHNYFNNQQLLLTYREGEVLYGTYYFLEIHYCDNGYYGLYGNTIKKTVLGNEQKTNWQEYGTWKITSQNGINGIHYMANNGNQQFYPLYKLSNGDLFIKEGVSIVRQGKAICK
ncbi:hypothetical protein [Flavivirga spongiicola]|uniref:Nicotinic acid mononucleotide adenyltransferase n=1 Tax=Flavivirga spongiicola TaxID=421621 RepID=A0ABU7XXR9_9FLAO|nr:hypothetical protein [Flavivirga sp. MEBiC05379]MDO5980588.1 hypothetical protein [Flavivirga sp. MEBiC05379]